MKKRLNLLVLLAIVVALLHIFVIRPAIADDVGLRCVGVDNKNFDVHGNVELFYYHELDSNVIPGFEVYAGVMEYKTGGYTQKAGCNMSFLNINLIIITANMFAGVEQHNNTTEDQALWTYGSKFIKTYDKEGSIFAEIGQQKSIHSTDFFDSTIVKIGFTANF